MHIYMGNGEGEIDMVTKVDEGVTKDGVDCCVVGNDWLGTKRSLLFVIR
mgnify:CR=1 FL=1